MTTGLGAVELRSIKGNINAKTKGGEIKIFDPTGDVSAETELGKVTLRSREPVFGHYTLKSNLGNISFQVPGESDLTIDVTSHVGDINVLAPSATGVTSSREGPSQEAHFRLGEGKGSAVIEVNTGLVDVTVR